MTTISQSPAQPAFPNLVGGLIRRIGIWAYALATYWERRAAIKALSQLDDRQLRDIGLARCHIERAVFGGTANPEIGRFQ
jgi:uncharacterized protein YjiS (DUF1127 family)